MVNTKQDDTYSTSTLAVGCLTGAANLESHLVQKLAVKASSLKISVAVFPVQYSSSSRLVDIVI